MAIGTGPHGEFNRGYDRYGNRSRTGVGKISFPENAFAANHNDDYKPLPSNELAIETPEAEPGNGEKISADADKPKKKAEKIVKLDLEIGFDRYSYYTRYQIGGNIISRDGIALPFFPVSELKFPLDVFTIYLIESYHY